MESHTEVEDDVFFKNHLIYGGYSYTIAKKNMNMYRWRCHQQKKFSCNGSISTSNTFPYTGMCKFRSHSHPPDTLALEVKKLRLALRKHAAHSSDTLKQLLAETLKKVPDPVQKKLGNLKSIKRDLLRYRRMAQMSSVGNDGSVNSFETVDSEEEDKKQINVSPHCFMLSSEINPVHKSSKDYRKTTEDLPKKMDNIFESTRIFESDMISGISDTIEVETSEIKGLVVHVEENGQGEICASKNKNPSPENNQPIIVPSYFMLSPKINPLHTSEKGYGKSLEDIKKETDNSLEKSRIFKADMINGMSDIITPKLLPKRLVMHMEEKGEVKVCATRSKKPSPEDEQVRCIETAKTSNRLDSTISRPENISNTLESVKSEDSLDLFGRYLVSLLRDLPLEKIHSLQKKFLSDVFCAKEHYVPLLKSSENCVSTVNKFEENCVKSTTQTVESHHQPTKRKKAQKRKQAAVNVLAVHPIQNQQPENDVIDDRQGVIEVFQNNTRLPESDSEDGIKVIEEPSVIIEELPVLIPVCANEEVLQEVINVADEHSEIHQPDTYTSCSTKYVSRQNQDLIIKEHGYFISDNTVDGLDDNLKKKRLNCDGTSGTTCSFHDT